MTLALIPNFRMKHAIIAVVLAVCALGAMGDDWFDGGDDGHLGVVSGYSPSFSASYVTQGASYPSYATYGSSYPSYATYGSSYPSYATYGSSYYPSYAKGGVASYTSVTPRVTGYAKAVDTLVNQPYPVPVPVPAPGFGGPLAFGAGFGAAQNNGGGLFSDDSGLLIGGGLLLLALLLRNSNTSG